MNIFACSACTWLYPDTEVLENASSFSLDAARGGMAAFQLLTDQMTARKEKISVTASNLPGLRMTVYQLLPVCVDKNSGKNLYTGPYEDVNEFVTRKAPFMLFDPMREMEDGLLYPGRIAFYIKIEADALCSPGKKEIKLQIAFGGESLDFTIHLHVHKPLIPALSQAHFGMINWLNIDEMLSQHQLSEKDPAFDEILSAYLLNQLEMRNTQLQLPSGKPIRDEKGRIVSFDFSLAERVGNAALRQGFPYVLGGFVARFKVWNESEHFLLWDRDVGVTSHEGYRQLKLYFSKAHEVMQKNGWAGKYMQTLVDEPQFPNSAAYRCLSAICRKFLPDIPIHDPVESTQLDGALDIWDVKQAVFEKYIDEYKQLQEMGEEIWLYTCGFPAGKMMNRVMDLPLTASLLPLWLCSLYGCKGFLHWGYNVHTEKPFEITCYRPDPKKPDIAYPAGNAHIVYPGSHGPLWSVRAMLQRMGAEDCEFFFQLGEKDSARMKALIQKACRNFSDYSDEGDLTDKIRKELLFALDEA